MLQPSRTADERFAWWCAGTIFLSAFLLFQVQPVIGKMVLPWFGGSPSVWTTCMLFFQVLLVGGYAYADRLVRLSSHRAAVAIHGVLLIAAVCLLPITPSADWKPHGIGDPTWYLLLLLAAHVGLPYFLLSTTGPLIQAWFSRIYPARSPYRLYALSNVGSMGALLSYPFLFEPALTTLWQGRAWSAGFVLFCAMCGGLAFVYSRLSKTVELPAETKLPLPKSPAGKRDRQNTKPSPFGTELTWSRRAAWILLPALASVMLLAVTNYLCQDIAVSPLMWVLPLSLYLLTFIICFDRERWYSRAWWSLLAAVAVLAVCNLVLAKHMDQLYGDMGFSLRLSSLARRIDVQAFAYLLMLFAVCMLCHGELVRLKPAPSRLTSFYLSVSIGGALGGLFVGVVCPHVMDNYYELPVATIVSYVLAVAVFARSGFQRWVPPKTAYQLGCGVIALLGLYVVSWAQWERYPGGSIARTRNFYGVLSVQQHYEGYEEHPDWFGLALYHGRILHGYQYLREDLRDKPTTYYVEDSGVGLTLRNFPRPADRGLRVSLVGLGAGTLACYGQKGDTYRFYEINPEVIAFARQHFSFLSDAAARGVDVDVELGDARLTLEDEQGPKSDVIVLDAFSGDAIPTHLLTKEAFELYDKRLADNGVICVHISNRHLDLEPIVARLAENGGWTVTVVEKIGAEGLTQAESDWMLVTRNVALLNEPAIDEVRRPADDDPAVPLWTDQYSNLLQILRK